MKTKKSVSDSTLIKYFRLAVLHRDENTCQICGNTDIPQNLEAHHIVKRRGSRVLKYDCKNGATVHRGDCHRMAHKLIGKDEIKFKIGDKRWQYLKEGEQYLYPDWLLLVQMTDNEWREKELSALRNILIT